MSFIIDPLPFHSEFIHGIRHEAIRDFAISTHLIVDELLFTSQNGFPKHLKKLHIAYNSEFIVQLIESHFSLSDISSPSFSIDFEPPNNVWIHNIFNDERFILSTMLKLYPDSYGILTLAVDSIIAFGITSKHPLDLFFNTQDDILKLVNQSNSIPYSFELDSVHANLIHHPIKLFLQMTGNEDIHYESGHTKVFIQDDLLHILYDDETSQGNFIAPKPDRIIYSTRFFNDLTSGSIEENLAELGVCDENYSNLAIDINQNDISISEEMSMFKRIREYGKTLDNQHKNWLFSEDNSTISDISSDLNDDTVIPGLQNSPQTTYKLVENDPDTPAIKAIHRAFDINEKISSEAAHLALDEAAEKLSPILRLPLLYLLHLWAPELDESLKFEVLCAATHDSGSARLPITILKKIYQDEHNGPMLFDLLQRQQNESSFSPRKRILNEIECAELLSLNMKTPNMAVRRLDALKSFIQKYALPEDHIRFALAYHHAQVSNFAIQHLKQCILQASTPEEITTYGYQLALIMFEHNEPIQSIITVCNQVLDANPHHYKTLELLAQCLEATNRFPDAADAWQFCFDQLIHQWELARAKMRVTQSDENAKWLQNCYKNAVHAANVLEKLLDAVDHTPMTCIVLKQHMKLEPNSMPILAKLLKNLESAHAFHEMANECLCFLDNNAQNIAPTDEISIRLTLHNIYDCKLDRPDDAIKQLNIARNIAALDPRVISTEIERCRRRGLKTEQIGLRLALIDALPPQDAVPQTLELVLLYESLQADISLIVDILRKTNTRAPNNPQILLELRYYLRKLGQNFELANVLEKLARVTKDLQTKKNILLEASEVHEKLGNHQIAQDLYHEALLCSPINPNSKAEFMPQNLHAQLTEFNHDKSGKENLSSLSSVILTSRSLSIVEDLSSLISEADNNSISENDISSDSKSSENNNAPDFHDIEEISDAISSSENALDESASIEDQIFEARIRGNTQALLERLILSIENLPENDQPPRILQEIACIYLYDRHDPQTARLYLEKASELSHDVAYGEQTLNALEVIYQSLKLYRELSEVYVKKCEILTIADERRKYEIRLAQLRYDQLGETDLAIDTLNHLLIHTPENETALQLLAQIYLDTQNINKAIEVLNKITSLITPDSKKMAQHILRLISIYMGANKHAEARNLMKSLINDNNFVDKLAVIELYKTSCRDNDEWEELSHILKSEIAYYLKIPQNEFDIPKIIQNREAVMNATHTLREYADILYQKLQQIDEPVAIYQALYKAHPEDKYPLNSLIEISEQHPEISSVVKALNLIVDAHASETTLSQRAFSAEKAHEYSKEMNTQEHPE